MALFGEINFEVVQNKAKNYESDAHPFVKENKRAEKLYFTFFVTKSPGGHIDAAAHGHNFNPRTNRRFRRFYLNGNRQT